MQENLLSQLRIVCVYEKAAYSEYGRILRGQSLQYDDENGAETLTHEAIRHMEGHQG